MTFAGLMRMGADMLGFLKPSSTTAAAAAAAAAETPVTKETLFPVVTKDDEDEDRDADECDYDCDACPGYGRAFDKIGIDTDGALWGRVEKYSTHAIVATGETNWTRDVKAIEGSVMQALAKEEGKIENGRMIVSASNLLPPMEYYTAEHEGKPKPTNVVLLPAFVVVEDVTPNDTEALVREFVNPGPTTDTPLDAPASPTTTTIPTNKEIAKPPSGAEKEEAAKPVTNSDVVSQPSSLSLTPKYSLKSHPYPHDFLVLICSHRHRDARCGISAPILRKEFEKHLRPLGLWRDLTDTRAGGACVVFINHVGGHKFAANIIIYRKEDGQGLWLSRVAPKHVQAIVKYTLVKGKVVDPDMVRGGFNRRKGLASW